MVLVDSSRFVEDFLCYCGGVCANPLALAEVRRRGYGVCRTSVQFGYALVVWPL